jgi:hypothetical protein
VSPPKRRRPDRRKGDARTTCEPTTATAPDSPASINGTTDTQSCDRLAVPTDETSVELS